MNNSTYASIPRVKPAINHPLTRPELLQFCEEQLEQVTKSTRKSSTGSNILKWRKASLENSQIESKLRSKRLTASQSVSHITVPKNISPIDSSPFSPEFAKRHPRIAELPNLEILNEVSPKALKRIDVAQVSKEVDSLIEKIKTIDDITRDNLLQEYNNVRQKQSTLTKAKIQGVNIDEEFGDILSLYHSKS